MDTITNYEIVSFPSNTLQFGFGSQSMEVELPMQTAQMQTANIPYANNTICVTSLGITFNEYCCQRDEIDIVDALFDDQIYWDQQFNVNGVVYSVGILSLSERITTIHNNDAYGNNTAYIVFGNGFKINLDDVIQFSLNDKNKYWMEYIEHLIISKAIPDVLCLEDYLYCIQKQNFKLLT